MTFKCILTAVANWQVSRKTIVQNEYSRNVNLNFFFSLPIIICSLEIYAFIRHSHNYVLHFKIWRAHTNLWIKRHWQKNVHKSCALSLLIEEVVWICSRQLIRSVWRKFFFILKNEQLLLLMVEWVTLNDVCLLCCASLPT